MNIYVSNLRYDATEQDIRALFATFGTVTAVSLIKDRDTGQSRGFAFVEMAEDAEALKAIQELNGKDFRGRSITVNQARPRDTQGGRPGGGGGYSRNQNNDRRNRNW